ncbi:MAG: hypothetical protein D6824_00455, partial [Planctomycetota bacterium]
MAALALMLLWVAVYWLWPSQGGFSASPTSAIRFDATPPLETTPSSSAAPVADRQVSAQATGTAAEASAAVAASQPPAVQPPRFTERVVQAGQTMQSLAEEVYGDAALWEAIAKAN